jgi:hypothetical protein
MCQDELRYWIRQFLYDPAFGWSHCKLAFARFLGIDLHGLKSKIRQGCTQGRFCGGEQIRFSQQIHRLLAGETVPRQMRAPSGQMKWEAVLADHPQPIHRQGPLRLRVDLARGRWGWEVAPSYDFNPGSRPINELRCISLIKLITFVPDLSGSKRSSTSTFVPWRSRDQTNMSASIFGGAPCFSLSGSKAGKARRQSPRPIRDELSPSCGRCVVGVGLLRRGATSARGYLLPASGYLSPALGYSLPARGYLLAGCLSAWSRASADGTRRGSSRHRPCRPASAPGNPGGCPAYHHGDRPRRSARTWLL